ncbi:MAG: hypothetical protein AAF939_17240 [Planctomycetota bacterium]
MFVTSNSGTDILIRYLSNVAVVLTFVVGIILNGDSSLAQSDRNGNPDWRQGKQLNRFSQQGLSASFSNAPLGTRLRVFAKNQLAAVFIDRRLDPMQEMNLSMHGTLERLYWQVARQSGGDCCRIEDFYYVGPKTVAAQLPVAFAGLKQQKLSANSPNWKRRTPISTAQVVVPKQWLKEITQEAGVSVSNIDLVPNDVWSKVELPETSLEVQVGILLVGFDLWYERSVDAKTITIVPFPNIASGQREFFAGPGARSLVSSIRPKYPQLKISASGNRITTTGGVLEMAQLRADLVAQQGENRSDTPAQQKVYTLKTRAARGSILATIAQRTKRKFNYDKKRSAILREQITVELKDATLEQLLESVLDQTDLEVEITDTLLKIK